MNVLFCNLAFPEARARLAKLIEPAGHKLKTVAANEILTLVDWADVLIPLNAKLGEEAMAKGRFGLIQQYGVGLESVDIEAATRHGIYVARVPGDVSGNALSVAEHVIYMLLALSRHLKQSQESLAEKKVGQPTCRALCGTTACIVGLGAIGRMLAPRLHALGLKLIGVHNHPLREPQANLHLDEFYDISNLDQAIAQADHVIVCLNYKPEMRHLFNRERLAKLKPSAYLVNVARGGFVDLGALEEALRLGKLAGAGLDVFDPEPVDPDHPVFRQNVFATPHVAGVTDLSYQGIAEACAENILAYAKGRPPQNAVNAPDKPRGFAK